MPTSKNGNCSARSFLDGGVIRSFPPLAITTPNFGNNQSEYNGGTRFGCRELSLRSLYKTHQFLETDLEKLKAAVSMGYARGKLFDEAKTLPRDRKDWYD